MEYSIQTPHRKFSRKRKLWLGTLVLVLVIVGLVSFWAMSSNQASIVGTGRLQAKAIVDLTYNGKYETFSYPNSYTIKSQQVTKAGEETATFSNDTTYEELITLRVEPNGGEKLSTSDSSYYMRQSHPELYQSQQITVAGSPATEFIRDDGTEISVYIPHGNMYADLAFSRSGTNDTSGLSDEVTKLLGSFEWK